MDSFDKFTVIIVFDCTGCGVDASPVHVHTSLSES